MMCIVPSIKVPDIPEPEPIPTPVSMDVITSMEERRAKLRAKTGRQRTILAATLDEEEAPTRKKTLLGA